MYFPYTALMSYYLTNTKLNCLYFNIMSINNKAPDLTTYFDTASSNEVMLLFEAPPTNAGMSARYSPIMSSLSELSSKSRKEYFPDVRKEHPTVNKWIS